MSRCLFSYDELENQAAPYNPKALRALNKKLTGLKDFPYSNQEQLRISQRMATKLSIQGVQPKLSVRLNIKGETFELCEKGGTFIVKPQVEAYPHLPENEDLTMKLAKMAKIEVPWHGLVRSIDGKLSYVIRRFDRITKNKKLALEDFGQLIGASRSTKYLATMERVAEVIEEFCTYPTVEGQKLFRRFVFSYLVGNEDLHLKNFSLITRNNKVELSPAYDLVNSTLALAAPEEELALELRGKKKGFNREDFISYGKENLFLSEKVVCQEIEQLLGLVDPWKELISRSFLPGEEQSGYLKILSDRLESFA